MLVFVWGGRRIDANNVGVRNSTSLLGDVGELVGGHVEAGKHWKPTASSSPYQNLLLLLKKLGGRSLRLLLLLQELRPGQLRKGHRRGVR